MTAKDNTETPGGRPHPGEVIRRMYLERLGVSVSDGAAAIGVSRKNFSQLLNGHFAVSPEMAIRLSRAFGTAPQMWLMLQMEFDLEQAEKKLADARIEKLAP